MRPWTCVGLSRGAAALILLLLLGAVAEAAPKAELWPRWQAHDPAATAEIDHSAWAAFQDRSLVVVEGDANLVAYGAVIPADRAALADYIATLEAVPISAYARDEQMAFWINLYNALVVRLVLDHYPVPSVFEIAGNPGGPEGPWDLQLAAIDGTPVSLHDIQHRILRPIWRDPRVHYALSCGAVGCPNLQPEPFRGDRIEHQLNKAAMAYINDPRCIQVEDDRLIVSSLYGWYKHDFSGTDRTIISHLMAYAEPRLAMTLQRFDRIRPDIFDSRLNDAAYAAPE